MSEIQDSKTIETDSAAPDAADLPSAPCWRRVVARAIDLTVVAIIFALFLAPILITRSEAGSSLLKASAWVYVAVFVALAVGMVVAKTRGWRRRQEYVTVGMSIMDLRAVQVGRALRLVEGRYLPPVEGEKRGRAAAATIVPLIVLGVVFLLFELVSYR